LINVQDLETAVILGLKNLIYVIANNNAWGMIKSGQKLAMGKRFIDVDLPEFNYAKYAEGFGCWAEVVSEPNQIIFFYINLYFFYKSIMFIKISRNNKIS